MTTQLQSSRQELLKLKAEGKELLQQLFALKDEKRAALVTLLQDASPENQKTLRSIYQTNNKNLNEKWRSEHADLIARFKSLKEQVKSDNAVLQELLEYAKKIWPADEEFYSDLEALFLWIAKDQEKKALGTITESDLLNKPNMTAEDKKNMQDVLNFMKSNPGLRTPENLKKLYDNVHYHHNAIEIAGRKWSRSYRESSKVWPRAPEYISDPNDMYKSRAFYKQKTGLQYFNHAAAPEEDKVMRKQGMYLPSKEDFEAPLLALPWDYKEGKGYLGGNIFNLLLNGKDNYTGFCDSRGSLGNETSSSYLWSASPGDAYYAWSYYSDAAGGELGWDDTSFAFPIRPLVQ